MKIFIKTQVFKSQIIPKYFFTEKEVKRLVDICKDTPGLCTNGKCVNTDDGGYICECNKGFMNVAVVGGYRCQGRFVNVMVIRTFFL